MDLAQRIGLQIQELMLLDRDLPPRVRFVERDGAMPIKLIIDSGYGSNVEKSLKIKNQICSAAVFCVNELQNKGIGSFTVATPRVTMYHAPNGDLSFKTTFKYTFVPAQSKL